MAQEDRLGARRTVLLQARCRKSSLHVLSIELDDLSDGGCSIIGNTGAFAPGETIQLRIAGLKPIKAQVRWCEGNRTGVAFCKALDPHQMEELTAAYGIARPT